VGSDNFRTCGLSFRAEHRARHSLLPSAVVFPRFHSARAEFLATSATARRRPRCTRSSGTTLRRCTQPWRRGSRGPRCRRSCAVSSMAARLSGLLVRLPTAALSASSTASRMEAGDGPWELLSAGRGHRVALPFSARHIWRVRARYGITRRSTPRSAAQITRHGDCSGPPRQLSGLA
jgi:hypothetical protein